jgi:glutamate-1-semialdehyde 2,1-aminomutase
MSHSGRGRYGRSAELYEAALELIPGGVNSNVRLRSTPVPLFFSRADGARIWDVDGNEYVDYSLGMGAVILGHAHPAVTARVAGTLASGQLFGGQHEGELALARLVSDVIPWAGMVRLAMSGTEADQAAVRLARAATGRTRVVKFEGHYHGWSDGLYVSSRPPAEALPAEGPPRAFRMSGGQPSSVLDDIVVLPWNDEAAFSECFADASTIAAVILEPILFNTSLIPPSPGFIELLRRRTAETGVVLIFDEVITGFRVDLQGAAHLLGIEPDLAVYAKAMGNGFPIASLTGRRSLMSLIGSEASHHLGTYNGNVVSVSAGLATIETLRERQDAIYPELAALGARLAAGLRQAATAAGVGATILERAGVVHSSLAAGPPPRDYREYVLGEDFGALGRFVAELQDRGVRVTNRGTWFLSVSHGGADIDWTIERAFEAFRATHR